MMRLYSRLGASQFPPAQRVLSLNSIGRAVAEPKAEKRSHVSNGDMIVLRLERGGDLSAGCASSRLV